MAIQNTMAITWDVEPEDTMGGNVSVAEFELLRAKDEKLGKDGAFPTFRSVSNEKLEILANGSKHAGKPFSSISSVLPFPASTEAGKANEDGFDLFSDSGFTRGVVDGVCALRA